MDLERKRKAIYRGLSPKALLWEESLARSQESKAGSHTLRTWHAGIATEGRADQNPLYGIFYQTWSSAIITGGLSAEETVPIPILSLRAGLRSRTCSTPGSEGAPPSHIRRFISKSKRFSLGLPLWCCPCPSWMLHYSSHHRWCSLVLEETLMHPNRAQ